jgi:hypothetical protein
MLTLLCLFKMLARPIAIFLAIVYL